MGLSSTSPLFSPYGDSHLRLPSLAAAPTLTPVYPSLLGVDAMALAGEAADDGDLPLAATVPDRMFIDQVLVPGPRLQLQARIGIGAVLETHSPQVQDQGPLRRRDVEAVASVGAVVAVATEARFWPVLT